jgi:hypothetical protein
VGNVSIGFEWMITPAVPLRFGFFSNRSYYPRVDNSNTNQNPHVDVSGLVIGSGYEGSHNKFFGALKIGSGTGEDKIYDQLAGQFVAVTASSYTMGLILGMNYSF